MVRATQNDENIFSTLYDNLVINTVLDNGHVKCSWKVEELSNRKERQQEVISILNFSIRVEHDDSSAVNCLRFKNLATITTR